MPPRAKTEAELAEEKRRRDLRNINITLYSASLLLVAAAALFIGISIPEQARFAGVVVLTGLFYTSGLVIHTRRKNLRPAAVAFTGTGLALIPVVGLALYNFLLQDAALAWLVTSVAGTAAFAYAAARLESRVVSYLALTFLLSTALASGAAVRSGIVWYFVFTVVLATIVSLAAIRRPGWLKNVYLEAFVTSHRYLIPATAAVAVLTAGELGSGPLAVLFLAIAGYYSVLVWQGPPGQTLVHSYGVRAAATTGLTALAHYGSGSLPLTLLAAVALLGVQAAAVLVFKDRYLAKASLHTAGSGQAERFFQVDAATVLGVQFLAGLTAAAAYGIEVRSGDGNVSAYTVSAVLMLLTLCAAAWRLKGGAEPAAAAALLPGMFPLLLSARGPLWPPLLLLGMLTGYLVLRAALSAGSERRAFVLAARSAGTLLVPLAVFTVLEVRAPGAVWTWTLAGGFAAVAINQAISVLRRAAGHREQFPDTVLAVSAGAGVVLAFVLRFEEAPGTVLTLCALWIIVAVNVLASLLLRREANAVAAPVGFTAAGILGAGILGLAGYELLAAAALGYCAVQALKLAPRALRGYYLAAAQILLTLLTVLIGADLDLSAHGVFLTAAISLAAQNILRAVLHRRLDPFGLGRILTWGVLLALALLPPVYYAVLRGEARAETATILLLVAAGSAVFTQLVSAVRLRSGTAAATTGERGTVAAAALALLLTLGTRMAEAPGTALAETVLWTAFGANLLTALLHRNTRLALAAPAGFLAAALLGTGVLGLRGYEVLVLLAAGHASYLATRRNQTNRGQYLLGVQILAAILAVLIAADAGATMHGAVIAGSVVLAGAQILRTVLEPRLAGIGLASAAHWTTTALLAVGPAGYAWAAGPWAQRDVVAVQLLLLLAVAVSGFARRRAAVLLYPAVSALGALPLLCTGLVRFHNAGLLSGTVLGALAAGTVLIVLAAAALAGEARQALSQPVRTVLLSAAAAYPAAALLLAAAGDSELLAALALTALAAVFLTVSYTRPRPWLALGVPPLLAAAALAGVGEFERSVLWAPLTPGYGFLWPAWTAALLLQGVRFFISLADEVPGTRLRSRIMGVASAFALLLGAVPAMAEWNHSAVAGSLTLLAALALSLREVPPGLREAAAEAAVLPAALAVQRIGWFALADRVDAFWSVQYWAVILAALAAWEHLRKRAGRGTVLLGASALLLSGSGLTTIGSGGAREQLWALLAHAGLLAFGLLASRKLFTSWGAAGVALAVLWYLRGYTFLLLALLAAGLIALAVWRLARVRSEPEEVRGKEESRL